MTDRGDVPQVRRLPVRPYRGEQGPVSHVQSGQRGRRIRLSLQEPTAGKDIRHLVTLSSPVGDKIALD